LPRHEGKKMKGGVWPNVRLSVIALAVATLFAGTLSPSAFAGTAPAPAGAASEPSSDLAASNPHPPTHPRNHASRQPHQPQHAGTDTAASDAIVRTSVPPDLDQRRRDGHMTPEERRLLRQHIEDAVRELYKR
jgi:hypothetical protein